MDCWETDPATFNLLEATINKKSYILTKTTHSAKLSLPFKKDTCPEKLWMPHSWRQGQAGWDPEQSDLVAGTAHSKGLQLDDL